MKVNLNNCAPLFFSLNQTNEPSNRMHQFERCECSHKITTSTEWSIKQHSLLTYYITLYPEAIFPVMARTDV